ncbi:hypothetical protein LX32DRAFT_84555 [Colletotrichum zoysiae]|uniref:Uncharacterized protein n=1 Tax=Colletotrichum zoysiae TaxID=1216348 RepID=A0AAD9LWF6_9PEZI|nr:hypothetical protein LX32DRAFT_84555 [Colletotrichum zoysiae]
MENATASLSLSLSSDPRLPTFKTGAHCRFGHVVFPLGCMRGATSIEGVVSRFPSSLDRNSSRPGRLPYPRLQGHACCVVARSQHAPLQPRYQHYMGRTHTRALHRLAMTTALARHSRHLTVCLSVCLSVWAHGKDVVPPERNIVCASTTSPSPNGTLLVGGRGGGWAACVAHATCSKKHPTGRQPRPVPVIQETQGNRFKTKTKKKVKIGHASSKPLPSYLLLRICNEMQCHASAPPVREMECRSMGRRRRGGRTSGGRAGRLPWDAKSR